GRFELILYSNPGFTAQVLVSSARALQKMKETFGPGAYNMTQVPPDYYSPKSPGEIREELV
ncbi:MAG: diaminopimelate dehydrogenase, partial [Hadesarchaea archaeon]|nr:diaminopimelate dehydrogenase [Hadesarchaea archaeon]